MIDQKEILDRLADLHKQATTDRSHHYTGKCVKDAIQCIHELRSTVRSLETQVDRLESHIVDANAQ